MLANDRSNIGRRSKRKGKAYEARVAELFTKFTGISFRRTPNSGGYNKSGGVVIADHLFSGDIICDNPNFIFNVEAKNRENLSLPALLKNPCTSFSEYWFQCLEDAARADRIPIMVLKPDHSNDWVCIPYCYMQILGLTKSNHYIFMCYHNPVTLITIKRTNTGKKISKYKTVMRLPTPAILDWSEFTKWLKPELCFNLDIKNNIDPKPNALIEYISNRINN